jgi:hypothetical protein
MRNPESGSLLNVWMPDNCFAVTPNGEVYLIQVFPSYVQSQAAKKSPRKRAFLYLKSLFEGFGPDSVLV